MMPPIVGIKKPEAIACLEQILEEEEEILDSMSDRVRQFRNPRSPDNPAGLHMAIETRTKQERRVLAIRYAIITIKLEASRDL
jgi:hypothetical protein